ncbi:MAG TPA: 3'-5' exonuclease, partial [bacterium]|nr:3'-5' exonuclease [bacterium]
MVAFARIANEPKRGLGPKSLEKIESAAREAGSLTGISEDAAAVSKLFPAKAAPLIGVLRRLHGLRGSVPVPELVRAVLEDTGYYSYVERMDKQEGVSRAENLEEFFKLAHEYAKEASKPTLEGFLSKVSLVSDSDVEEGDESRARMLTLHSAKGLEFPVVFIVGLEEGMLPHGNALGDADGDREERRLCYVGATRAKELLYLSACKGRMTRGVACNNDISRFIMEIGPDRFKMLEGARGGASPGESFFDTAPGGGSDEAVERSTAIRLGGADADGFSREPADDDYSVPRRASSKKSSASSRGFDSDRFDGVDEEIIREKCGFRAGDKVAHNAFGTGRIVSFKGDEICVAFENIGIKRLSARYAPLVKID